MPQMEFAHYPPQLVWLTITFVVLYFLMARVVLPRIADVLESREQRIANDIERAEVMGHEAETAEREYERIAAKTHADAQGIAAEMREKLQAQQAGRIAELDKRLAADAAKAEAEINEAREKAMNDLGSLAKELAQAAVAKLLGRDVGEPEAAKAVDAEMNRN